MFHVWNVSKDIDVRVCKVHCRTRLIQNIASSKCKLIWQTNINRQNVYNAQCQNIVLTICFVAKQMLMWRTTRLKAYVYQTVNDY